MYLAVVAALTSTFLFSAAHVIEANLSNKKFKQLPVMLFYISTANFMTASLLFLSGEATLPEPRFMFSCFLWGLIDIGSCFFTYKAYKHIDTSIANAISSLGRIPIAIMAYYFLKEYLNLNQYLGFAIVILSSLILSIKNLRFPKINAAFYLVIISTSIRSMEIIVSKYALNINSNWINMTIYTNYFSSFIAFGFYLFYSQEINSAFKTYKKNLKFLLLDEVICIISHVMNFYAISKLTVLGRSAIGAFSPNMIMLIGIFLQHYFKSNYNEQVSHKDIIKKTICFSFVILGTILTIKG